MLRFGIWSLLCLFGSTDFAGKASHTALGYVLRLLGFLSETGGTAAASITLFWQKGAHVVLFSVLGMLSANERKLWY